MGCITGRVRLGRLAGVLAATMAFAVPSAWAQSGDAGAQAGKANAYPTKAIHLIVGFAAGGGNDIITRLVAQKLSEALGQPVLVENKPGAGGIIAAEYVKNAAPDGYTLLSGPSGTMSFSPALYPKLGFSTMRDFAPIVRIGAFPLVLVVDGKSQFHTVKELIDFAKAHPDKANFAGTAASMQLVLALFKAKTGAPFQFVAYKSGTDAVNAVVAEGVTMSIMDAAAVSGPMKDGRLRALAVASAKRAPDLPNVPTLAEAGVPGIDAGLWAGVFAPAGTSPAIVTKLQDAFQRIMAMPDIRERLKVLAVTPEGIGAAEFGKMLETEIAQWKAIAKAANIKLEQ
jgi:tripartite-type tricarboxylate transporter receptor subunit TctC